MFPLTILPVSDHHFSFRHVYDYCTNVNNQGGRGNSVSIPSAATSKAKKSPAGGGAQFVGHELYKRLKDYLKSHLINVLKVFYLTEVVYGLFKFYQY